MLNGRSPEEQLLQLIDDRVNEKLSVILRQGNYIRVWVGTVTNIAPLTVVLEGEITGITGLTNDTGKTLGVNDRVYLHSYSGTLSNAFIARQL